MHAAVDLNHQLLLGAVKIDNVTAKGNLPAKFQSTGRPIPKSTLQPRLGRRLLGAQFTRALAQHGVLDVAVGFGHEDIMAQNPSPWQNQPGQAPNPHP